jgi:hypothetical protein
MPKKRKMLKVSTQRMNALYPSATGETTRLAASARTACRPRGLQMQNNTQGRSDGHRATKR